MAEFWQKLRGNLYVLLLGLAVSALAWVWGYDSPPPEMLDGIAAAAGLRPPTSPVSQLWLAIVRPLFAKCGIATAEAVLLAAGHISLGILAVVACILLNAVLPASLKRGARLASWWRAILRFVAFQGAVFFCCSDPVWSSFRWFSPHALHVMIMAVVAYCFVCNFKNNRRAPLFVAMALLGLLAADTPSGLLLTLVAAATLRLRRLLRTAGIIPMPDENPLADSLMAWRLTLAFLVGCYAGVTLGSRAFAAAGGLEAFGWTWKDYALEMPFSYLKAMIVECAPLGLALVFALAVLPMLIEVELLRRSTDDEKHLTYMQGLAFAALGLLAFSQICAAKTLWFWSWGSGTMADGVIKNCAMFLFALSATWSLGVFMLELYLRNFKRIATLRMPDAAEQPGAAEAFATVKRVQRVVRTCFLLEPLLALACIIPFRAENMERAMLEVVADAVRETADECRDVDFLFTDGGLDAAVEIAAERGGHRLRTLSLMGSAEDSRDIFLRTRGIDDPEDKALLESGAADALRMWVRTRQEKAKTYAVQIGFELWRRDGRPMPDCSGLVARPEGFTSEDMERGAAAGRELGRRILELYEDGDPEGVSDRAIRDAFLFTQWRLAVLARHRANAYDGCGNEKLALEETHIADELDRSNGALARIHNTMAWAGRKRLERLTPREGLRMALARTDFAMARVFALRVLDVSPEDPAANFALGMDFFVQKQYARAEAYLSQCLVHRPNDPAVLNNLAQCRLRQGDPRGALPYAERALEILPNAPQIKLTMKKAKDAAAIGQSARRASENPPRD